MGDKMRYKAELFDRFQSLYEETGFSDHQLHGVISFQETVDAAVMEKSFRLLLEVIPILSSEYQVKDGNACWKSVSPEKFKDVFTVTDKEEIFQTFSVSRTNEFAGPQIKACLYQSEKPSLSIVMNHMITDGAGFKQCLYLLSELYSKLKQDPCYQPDYRMDGDRSVHGIISSLTICDRLKALFLQSKENNQETNYRFPMNEDEDIAAFIVTSRISKERFSAICDYGKCRNATVNDVVLAAYDRALSKLLNAEGKLLNIPIMVDMRRYLKDKSFRSLTNLSSTVTTNIRVDQEESFEETLAKVRNEMEQMKSGNLGMNAFVKLDLVNKIFNEKTAYKIVGASLKNPYICMTNIGIIDEQKLVFVDSAIENVYVCGSIKYRPHFQMAVSSYHNTMTFSANLYGSAEDREMIMGFLEKVIRELP
jgi:NRPS condensation-like uncharacterized protein